MPPKLDPSLKHSKAPGHGHASSPTHEPRAQTPAPAPAPAKSPVRGPKQASEADVKAKAEGRTAFHPGSPKASPVALSGSPASAPASSPAVWDNPQAVMKDTEVRMPAPPSHGLNPDKPDSTMTVNGHPIKVFHVDPKQNQHVFEQHERLERPGNAPYQNLMVVQNGSKPTPGLPTQEGVSLGWNNGQAHVMKLGDAPPGTKFFTTAPLNSCALLVGGPPHAPTIMHVNYDHPELERMDIPPHQLGAHQAKVYKDGYTEIAKQAQANGLVPSENFFMLHPGNYCKPDQGMSKINVMGTKGEDGNWRLHYSMSHDVKETKGGFWPFTSGKTVTTKQPLSGELWPRPELGKLAE